jgi:hypothetical protein
MRRRNLPEAQEEYADNRRSYADRAMQQLHRAVQAGFKDADKITATTISIRCATATTSRCSSTA